MISLLDPVINESAPLVAAPVMAPLAVPPGETDRIAELQQTASASRLNCWHQCRMKFYFRYVLQVRKATTVALYVGTMAHAILQAWSLARWRREPFSIERFKVLYETQWPVLQAGQKISWKDSETKQRETLWRCLECYFLETPIRNEERPEAVEVRVEASLARLGLPTLIGVIDLVRAGGRIVDFKTAGQKPNPRLVALQHETQLSCYGVLYRDATGQVESGFELHHLVKTKKPKVIVTTLPPMTRLQETALFRLLESYVSGLERRDFVPARGMGCCACEYQTECRSWAGKEPWTASTV